MFRAIKIKPYGHVAEEEQFEDIRLLLEARYKESEESCLLLGNFNIEGVELDALLFLPGMIRVLEFKNWGGSIVATENGPWLADNKIVAGGAGKTPFEQARTNRSRVTTGLENRTHMRYYNVSASIIFRQDSQIDTSGLSVTTKKWFTVCDNAHLAEILQGGGTVAIGNKEIDKIPRQFGIDNLPAAQVQPYQSDAQDFFADIRGAINCLPGYQRMYRRYDEIFRSLLNQNTESTAVTLTGIYAKTDYLLKEHHADIPLIRAVNDLRVRLNKRTEMSDEALKSCCYADMKALCEFVALIYSVSVPIELSVMYVGKVSAVQERARAKSDYMRVLVGSWDERYIYGTCEAGDGVEQVKVCYTENGFHEPVDWTYLSDILYEGASINVVPPFEQNGIIYATFVIFEPDYLVNVQAIASCFTEYADSPMVALINKLKPSVNTDAITLGNFAGYLLDKSLREEPIDYNQCVRDFYKDNALAFLDLQNTKDFLKNGKDQQAHIEKVVNQTLPSIHRDYDKSRCIVEPSFFSEMLGLQGRMDYLQIDFKLLMEQKSGKGKWPDDYPHRTNARPEHYIQILLYMLIIRYNYHSLYYSQNKEQLNAYLLYSKYEEPLVDCNFVPKLVQQAIKIRNGIASLEMRCAQEGGFDLLSTLKADDLNEKKVAGTLWQRYQRPQIGQILSPIQAATDLERCYFLRFLTFVSKEHQLSKLGNKTKECSGFAAAWHESLEAKLAAGNIYTNLQLQDPEPDEQGGIKSLTLSYSEREDHVMSNFRKGDIVVLYPYEPSKTPDLRTTMVFRSTIDCITSDTITLKLRAPQSPRAFAAKKGCLWAFEHDFMESSSNSLYKGLHAFLSAPKSRRDLILLQREPQIDTTVTLTRDHGYFNDLVLRVKQARDLFLIIGPPGTGKTSCGMLYNVQEELHSNPAACILLLSYTNRAVDEICSKLEGEQIDYIRIGNEESCNEAYQDRLLSKIAGSTPKLADFYKKLLATRILVSTTASLNSKSQILALKSFSLCIVDEASQILEPDLIGILAACEGDKPAVEKLVLIGDHKQLPAVVQQDRQTSAVTQAVLNEIGLTNCRDSLFERLLRRYRHNPAVTYMLSRQGRMHAAIAQFASDYFYDGRLEVLNSAQQQPLPPLTQDVQDGIERMLLTRRVIFFDAPLPEEVENNKVNDVEARIIAHTALLAYKHVGSDRFVPQQTLGIIVPYRNQIAAVRASIERLCRQDTALTEAGLSQLAAITIDTVERFQGSERTYIIYGFTVQKKYQLKFLTDSTFSDEQGREIDRKLNVVVTRAKEHLIMVGHSPLLTPVPTFRRFIDFARKYEGYLSLR